MVPLSVAVTVPNRGVAGLLPIMQLEPEPLHMGNVVALPRALLLCVPMPNTSEPFSGAGRPLATTAGSSMITPLLSAAKSVTGFCNCCAEVTRAQLAAAVQVK